MKIHFRQPASMLFMPLSAPINDGLRDPRMKRMANYVDNTMPARDWSAFDSPARDRMPKKRRKVLQLKTIPVLLMRQAS